MDKTKDSDLLLQATALPKDLHLAIESPPTSNQLPAAPMHDAHEPLTFEELENHEGEALPCQHTLLTNRPVFYTPFAPTSFPQNLKQPHIYQQALLLERAPVYQHGPPFKKLLILQQAPLNQQAPTLHQAPVPPQPRQRAWRHRKAAEEDQERVAMGEPPKKRLAKEHYHYTCKECGQEKNKSTAHTQQKGRWYCPASGLTLDQWKTSLWSL